MLGLIIMNLLRFNDIKTLMLLLSVNNQSVYLRLQPKQIIFMVMLPLLKVITYCLALKLQAYLKKYVHKFLMRIKLGFRC